MAKLNLKDALSTSLERTKLYIDTELAKKANSSHGTHVSYGGNGSATTVSRSDHTHSYLPLSGGTMTGLITTPNNSQGIKIGDDAYLCDRNIADHIVIEGNTATNGGITFGSGKDTNIYRGGTNLLKTDDTMNAVGGFQWNGQSLDSRYAAASHGTHLTIGTGSGNAAAGNHTHTSIEYQDTSSANTTPDDVPKGLSVHFKTNGTDGLSDGGTYHSSLFIKGWKDYSGGPYGNIAISANNNLWFRSSSSGTAWNAWKKASVDGHTHSYLPLSGGTISGNIKFTDVTSTTYPAKSSMLTWNGSTDGADIYYQVDASDKGRLVLNTRDDADCIIAFASNGTIVSTIDPSGNFSGNAATASKVGNSMKVQLNGGTTEGTNQFTFDGSAAKTINITPASIGAAASSAQKNSDITKAEIEAKLTGNITSHNHTSLTGVTSLAFVTEGSDAGSISTVVDSSNTYFDFNLSDDPSQNDMWRWRFSPSGGTVFNAMTLDPTSSTEAKLTVTGNVTATSFTENGTALSSKYAAYSHGTHLTLGTGSGNAFRGDYGNTAYTHSQAAHAPSNAQKNSDITKAEIEAKLTGNITTHKHSSITAASGSSWTGTAVPNATDCLINFYSHINKSATGLFATGDNSNAIISINRHEGNYDSQLGFNSQGGIFYRFVDGTAITDSTAWHKVYTSLNKPTPDDIGATPAALGNAAYNHSQAAHAPSNAQKNSDITKAEIEAKLTGAITSHTHSYLPLSGGQVTGTIYMPANAAATSTDGSLPTQLAYGLLGSYGNLKVLGNTDTSTGADNEYVHIAAGWGLSPAADKGITVYGTYANCFGKKISTEDHTHSYIPMSGNGTNYNITGDLSFATPPNGTFRGVVGKCGANDYWRVGGQATADNAGFMEIATADDGIEPIYVRQYTGVYSTLVRTATLLDASGNTFFPGSVTMDGECYAIEDTEITTMLTSIFGS